MKARAAIRRFRPWRGIAFLAALVAFSLAGSGVWAYWSAGSGTSGTGAASATTVGAGATPSASWSGTTVTLSWAATTLANGTAVSGYLVKRYNATTLAPQTILSSCNGTITGLTCTESAVPTGSWRYSITPVFATNWTGAESPLSVVVYTDPTPPVNNLSLSNIVGGAAISGTTAYYRGSVAGSFTITNALTDVGSGPASSATSALTGATTGWTHTPSTVSTPTGGPYVSNTFSWAAGTTGSPSETVTGRDLANNTAITTGSLVNDSTPPTGNIVYSNGYQVGKYVTMTFSGADSGAGLLSGQLQRQSANFRSGGCAAFGAWTNLGTLNPVSPYTDSTVTNSMCYNYRYVLTDLVGNVLTATSASTAWVDYAGAVKSQSGVVSQLRLGDSAIGGNTTAVDSVGSLNPTYTSGVTLGTNGDPQNDPNTAVTLNGTTGWLQDTTPTGLPTGASTRSVELWFKTTSSAHQSLFTYGSYANNQEFGLWIDPNGATLTSWGWGGGDDPTFTTTSPVNDGKWHQVVLTYDGTAISLYLDGSLRGSSNQTRNTIIDAAGLQIGDVNDAADINTGFPFSGSLDEFSVYNVALTATDVQNHFQLGANQGTDSTGPTGGSVTPSGLGGTGGIYSTSTTLNLALVKGSDSSGVSGSAAYLYRASATLTSTGNADGVCGAFGAFSLVASDPAASFADTVPADNTCYAYRYSVPDVLGNYSTFASGMIKVDTTAPTTPSLGVTSTAGFYSGGVLYYRPAAGSSFTLTATTTDTTSGIPSATGYSFPDLGAGWTTTGSANSRTYMWQNTVATAGLQTVTVTNNASLSSAATFTLTIDSTAPVPTPPTYFNGLQTTTPITVTFTPADAGSGIATAVLWRERGTTSGTNCINYGAFTQVATASPFTDAGQSGRCYQYELILTDRVGNTVTTPVGGVIRIN